MHFTQKYFFIFIFLAIALGFVWPMPGLVINRFVVYLLVLMMILSCLKINLKELSGIKNDWWRYVVLLMLVYLLPVAIIWCFKDFLNQQIFIGLIVASSVPSAVSVVFMSDLLNGEPHKALIATTLAHLVSPIITPFLVWLFAHQYVDVKLSEMLLLIAKLVIVPLVFAQILRKFSWQKKVAQYSSLLNTILLVFLLWGIIAPAEKLVRENFSEVLKACVIMIIVLFISVIISAWFGRKKSEKITWILSGVYKNLGLSSVITLNIFGPMALVGTITHGIINNLIIIPLHWWANRKNK